MNRDGDRRRAVAHLAVLGLAIAVAFLAVSLAGIGPSDAERWIPGAGPAGPVVFVLAAGVLCVAPRTAAASASAVPATASPGGRHAP